MPSRDSVQDALQVLIDVQGPAWVVEPDIACCFEPDQKLRTSRRWRTSRRPNRGSVTLGVHRGERLRSGAQRGGSLPSCTPGSGHAL